MNGRCKNCNAYVNARQTRGSKLSNCRCRCGGQLEIVTTHQGDIYKNKNGELFTYIKEEGKSPYFKPFNANPNNGAINLMVAESVHAWNESTKNYKL